jgi:hypothetical protein
MITLIEFEEKYIINFDNYLIEQDNNLVNSNDFYLRYKNEYIISTNNNYKLLDDLLKIFNQLNNNYTLNTTKYIYNYINKSELKIVMDKIKKIIASQIILFNNFMNHISFLNNTNTDNIKTNNNTRMTKLSKR